MNLPKSIECNGIPWRVIVEPMPDENASGMTETNGLVVRIDGTVSEDQHPAAFWHELIHVFFHSRELKAKQLKSEEDIARAIGSALQEFMAHNAYSINWNHPRD